MITIKYIPNILKDEGRIIKEMPFVANKSLQDYLTETEFDTKETRIIVTGRVEKDLTITLKNGDEVLIFAPINVFLIPVAMTFWIAVANWTILVLAVLSLAYSIYSIITAPRAPSFGTTGEGLDEGSPTYGWDGVKNTQDVGVPIPIVYGENRVGGNIINQFIRTDGDKEYLNFLIALSEGEIESIDTNEINENPATNFDSIVLTNRYGTNTQAQLANFNDSHDLKALNANLVKNNAYVYTTINTDITAFELRFACVGGLFKSNATTGVIESWAVTYQVEYKLHADANYTDLGSTTIDGKSRTDLRRIFRKAGLAVGQYDIRVTRTSDDSNLSPMLQGDLYLKGVDEIAQDEPLIYPNVALLGVEALATDQLNGSTPTITSLVKGIKVSIPNVLTAEGGVAVVWDNYYYDPVSATFKLLTDNSTLYWDGTTYITAYSANPIWCLKDLLSNTRYGLGDYITTSNMDTAQLLEMAKYCEEKVSDGNGGYEKRFRLDVVIDSATKAIDLLTQLSATFRSFTFYSAGAVKLKIDKVESPVQMFGMGNIISESFTQSWKSIKEIPNVIEIQFMNKDLNYKQDTIAVMDEASIAAGDPIRKKSLRLFCTRTSQALREGKYALNLAKCIHRTVALKAGIDAIACQAGDIINVAHDVPAWGIGSGRVQADSTTTLVKLDQPVTLENAKTYKIRVRFADDTQEERYISNGAGTYTEVNVSSVFSNPPAFFDIYAIGEENKVVAPYRIVSMKRAENSEVEITALEYDADVYNTDIIVLPDNNYSALTLAVPDIENLTLTERLVKLGDGTIENAIDVWWTNPVTSNYVLTLDKVRLFISDNGGQSWTPLGETIGTSFSIIGNLIDGVNYKIAVVSIGYNGRVRSIIGSPSATIQLIGKSAAPANVTTFLVNQSRDRLYFGWSEVTDLDLAGYEIRYGNTWETSPAVSSGVKGNNLIILDFRTGNAQSFWIKAIDTSGNYSTTAKEAVLTIDNIPFTNIIESYSEQTAWGGTKSNLSKVGDNLEIDATYLFGTYVTPVRDIGYVATFKIGVNTLVTLSGDDTWQDFGEQTFPDLPDTIRFSGTEIAGATSFEIKTSEDNVTWSDWRLWQAGDYKCRYFQLRMTITRASTAQVLQCSELNYYADLPDIDEFQDGEVVTAGDGCAITFTKTLHENPAINITILTGDGFVWKQSGLSTTGVNIKLYKLDGTAVTGTFRIHIHGV